MGDPVLIAGAAGVIVVIITAWLGPKFAAWLERYHRAHGYEAGFARHVLNAGPGKDLDPELCATVTYGTVSYAPVSGTPPWPLTEPVWQSDLERAGKPVPGWADPAADRVGAYGLNSGSSGSDYHGGELPAAAGTGRRRPTGMGTPARGVAGSEAYGPPGQPPPKTWDDADPALDDTWARLLEAWGDGPAAPSPATGDTEAASSPGTVVADAPAIPGGARSAPGPADGQPPPGPGWAPSKLGTRFDVELAADAAAYMRAQNRDVAEDMAARLARLERACGVRL
jgi:hypothetical protein